MERKYLGFKEAAAEYSVSSALLRREAVLGRLRTMRIYGRVLIRPEDLAEWFEKTARPGNVGRSEQVVAA